MGNYYQDCYEEDYDRGLEKGYRHAETYGYDGGEARSFALVYATGYAEALDECRREDMERFANLIIDYINLAKLSPDVVFDSFEQPDYNSCLKMEIESRLTAPISERVNTIPRPNHYKRRKC